MVLEISSRTCSQGTPFPCIHSRLEGGLRNRVPPQGVRQQICRTIGSNYVTLEVQESDTCVGTDFANVAATDLVGAFLRVDDTISMDKLSQWVGYIGVKRYVRVCVTYTGTAITAGVIGVLGLLGIPQHGPAVAPAVPATT